MIQFSADFLERFLAVVRKYMQLRGGLTQKDLAEMSGVGISTMSRFLNLKTATIDEQLVANIIATLNIPLHEVIDGIEEESTETFKRLVQFYKDQKATEQKSGGEVDEFAQGLGSEGQTKTRTTATINVGGKKQSVSFGGDNGASGPTLNKTDITIRDKLQSLSPRQKAYLTDFLDLDQNDRDLIVDLGETVFRYFRQRQVNF
ncbi:MAG: helix-turn-helix domain-containing protein [Bacteriovoracaceae bacterium]